MLSDICPVRDGDAGVRDDLGEVRRDRLDVLHAVVHVEDLSLAEELTADRGRDLQVGLRADEGQDRVAVLRRGRERAHLADAGDRHLERARDRGRGHRQDVHVGLELLELVLVLDAEALLLVDDDEPDVLELDVLRQDPVRADDDVDGAVREARDRLLRLLLRLEPAERPEVHGEAGEALLEGLHVLPDEERRRHEHGDLLAVLHGLERRADRDLGLAVADVAGEQAVHGDRTLHVALDLVDGGQLVGGLGERERFLELALPRGVRAERVPLGRHARRVQLDEVDGDVADGLPGLRLRSGPVRAAHLRQGRALAADVPGELVELVGRDEELVTRVTALRGRVLEDEVLALRLHGVAAPARHLARDELDELADAVRGVHDDVAGLELQRVDDVLAPPRELLHRAGALLHAAAVELGLAEDRDARVRGGEAVLDGRGGHDGDARLGRRGEGFGTGGDPGVGEDLHRSFDQSLALGGHHDGPPVVGQLLDVRDRTVGAARERRDRLGADPDVLAGLGCRFGVGEDAVAVTLVEAGVERRDRPPGALPAGVLELLHGEEVAGVEVDRRLGTGDGSAPGGLEELRVGLREAVRTAADPLGREHRDGGVLRQVVRDRHEVLHERGSEGLHALDRDALGDLREHLRQVRELVQHLARPLPDVVGEQELARCGEFDLPEVVVRRALVGDGEGLDGLDLVTEEVDAHRVVGRGREDVEDATAHGELAAAGDEVDPGVREVDQLGGDRPEVVAARVGAEDHGCERGEVARDGLQRRADARDDHGRAAVVRRGVLPTCELPERGDPRAHGLRARAEALVRQGLPRGELEHVGVGDVAADGVTNGLGFAPGGGDDEHALRPVPLGEERGEQGHAQAVGHREVGVTRRGAEHAIERGGARERRDDARDRHSGHGTGGLRQPGGRARRANRVRAAGRAVRVRGTRARNGSAGAGGERSRSGRLPRRRVR
ncbi:hypothetical protein JOE58_003350 [Curtobacterium luteum]|uniref:Uncharacterized protein n=1 Tax=Curtobacterium luteum TaxID=33881 RepID=A0ABS2RYH9_9MICO|nr:hypothetical protein [Curtobacterium luteum]